MRAYLAIFCFFLTSCASQQQQRFRSLASYNTTQGLAVIDQKQVLTENLGPFVEEVLTWWAAKYPDGNQGIRAAVAGGALLVTAQSEPLIDPWYPQVGPAYGFTRDFNMQVLWDTRDKGANFLSTLGHELGHVALNAMRRGGPDHHKYFVEIGYPWR